MFDAEFPSIASLLRALQDGRLSPEEALQHQRDAFQRGAARWNCVTHHGLYQRAVPVGALHGVALAHKDVFAMPTRMPGQGRPEPPPCAARHAPVLAKLAASGATNLGALAMAEFACGATSENPHGPHPINPVDQAAVVGGSSSGSAVAVAAGMCFASLGTDTAGSVRIPAATCGIVGLKLTNGMLDQQGVAALAPSLDTLGVLGRSASDVAHVLAALLPSRAQLAARLEESNEIDRLLGSTRRWHVASALEGAEVSTEIGEHLAAFERDVAIRTVLRPANICDLASLARQAQITLHVEAAVVHAASLRSDLHTLASTTRSILLPGIAVPASWYRAGIERRANAIEVFVREHLRGVDVLLTPALPNGVPDRRRVHTNSPEFDVRELLALHRYHSFVNYLGLPAIVFPINVDAAARPVCVQAIGAPGSDEKLLAFAHQFAATTLASRAVGSTQ